MHGEPAPGQWDQGRGDQDRSSTIDAPMPVAPKLEGPAPRLLVVRAPYYADVVDGLLDGATRILGQAGAAFEVLDVAGALELAAAVRLAVRGSRR